MYDVYGLGNALVDLEYLVDDGYLRSQHIDKGHMTLVDDERMQALIDSLEGRRPERMSGGSAANTMYAVQGFGGRAFYSCKVADDEVGAYFLSDLNTAGIRTNANARSPEGTSGRCLVLVTPDAERSMNTYLGISTELGLTELDEAAIRAASYAYVEGYLSSSETALAAAIRCREYAEEHGIATALTLSDPSMINFFRDNLERMLGNGVTVLFCNEEEALDFAGTDRLDVAVQELKDIGRHLFVTLGARGSMYVTGHTQREVAGFPVKPVDTNGAGDMYAGACLYGLTHELEHASAARFANYAAGHLVQAYGARLRQPEDYAQLLRTFSH